MRTAVYGRGAGSTNGARAGLTVTGSIVLQDQSSADEPARAARVIWLLLGPKAGDNAQVQALAEALVARGGFRAETRTLRFHGAELLTQALRRPHTLGLAPSARAALGLPDSVRSAASGPDLVLAAGRRSEPVARAIRAASGGRTRIVHLGRPWAHPAAFDLVITSSQYDVPDGDNVLPLPLPLTAATGVVPPLPVARQQGFAAAPGTLGPELPFARLPRPWTGVLVGGNSGYLRFDAERARTMARALNSARAAAGGSWLVVGSPRTPSAFLEVLGAGLEQPLFLHPFSRAGSNPYRAVLGLADRLVVTSDSVSMVLEAIASGRPTYLHDVRPLEAHWWRHAGEYRWQALSHRAVQALAPRRLRRDVRRLHADLVARGSARWLTDGFVPFTPAPIDPAAALKVAVDRVLGLF